MEEDIVDLVSTDTMLTAKLACFREAGVMCSIYSANTGLAATIEERIGAAQKLWTWLINIHDELDDDATDEVEEITLGSSSDFE